MFPVNQLQAQELRAVSGSGELKIGFFAERSVKKGRAAVGDYIIY